MNQTADDVRGLVRRRSVGALPGYVGNFVTTSVMALLFARWMGVEDLGAYAFAFHLIRIVVLIAGLGLNMAAVRLIPRYLKHDRQGDIAGFVLGSALVTAVACALFGALVFLFSLPAIEGSSSHDALWHADWLAAILGVGILLAGVLRAHGHTLIAAVAQNSGRNIAAMLIAFLMVGSDGTLAAEEGLVALALAVLLALIVQVAVLLWHRRLPFVRPVFRPAEWVATSSPMMAAALGRLVVAGGDVIIIRLILGEAEAGLYHAAITLAVAANLAALAVSASIAPELARHDGPDDGLIWRTFYRYGLRLALIVDVIIAVLVIGLGRTMLGWFGADFVVAYPLLVVLTLAVLVQNVSFCAASAINMTGGARRALPWSVAFVFVALGLSVLGTWTYGTMGTAIAYGVARVLGAVMITALLRRHRHTQLTGKKGGAS